jgi:hypothetical protein
VIVGEAELEPLEREALDDWYPLAEELEDRDPIDEAELAELDCDPDAEAVVEVFVADPPLE